MHHETKKLLVGIAIIVMSTAAFLLWLAKNAEARTEYTRTYATCYHLRGTMANGKYVHKRAAASNWLKLGTKIRIVGKNTGPNGRRLYIISDTGGSPLNDGHLDLWDHHCGGWHNPRITFKRGWAKPRR